MYFGQQECERFCFHTLPDQWLGLGVPCFRTCIPESGNASAETAFVWYWSPMVVCPSSDSSLPQRRGWHMHGDMSKDVYAEVAGESEQLGSLGYDDLLV